MKEAAAPKTDTPATVKPQSFIDPNDVMVLNGHQSEVFSCAWNPVEQSVLATGYLSKVDSFFLFFCDPIL